MTDGHSSHAADAGAHSVARSERLLSWILAGFLLLALGWGYARTGDAIQDGRADGLAELQRPVEARGYAREDQLRELGLDYRFSEGVIEQAGFRAQSRGRSLERARERYRTAMEADQPTSKLETAYRLADTKATAADERLRELRRGRRAAVAKLRASDREDASARNAELRAVDAYADTTNRRVFLWRAALALGSLAVGLLVLRIATARLPRAVVLTQALVGAGALITLTLVVDYSAVNLDFYTAGPLGLAAIGSALTIAAFVGLQRYLIRHRPARRIRHGECAACGQPSTTPFCQSCGQPVIAPCGACQQPRRLGTAHCGACGAA
ncbi:MAG: zinc ribbon domain-containing protein [Solirubrobacteraceae bacterium]|nr:zinc ribbon domain-containing protein [Solirubrobacteraceae bacterium]